MRSVVIILAITWRVLTLMICDAPTVLISTLSYTYFIFNFNFSAILDFASVFVSHLLSLFSPNSMGIDATATQGDLRSTNKIDTNLLSRSPV